MQKKKLNVLIVITAALTLVFAVWGPEQMARYKDRTTLNQIKEEPEERSSEGYRYSLNSNEKLYVLSKCLTNQVLPQSGLSSMTRLETDVNYEELTGNYAFVVNHRGPSEKEITDEEVYETCNEGIRQLKELGIFPEELRMINASSYDAVLYSAIDVLEPRNNMSVWKVSLATDKQNANKENRLLDAYIDADTGKIYEFYLRMEGDWDSIDPDELIAKWSDYLGLTGQEEYEDVNPLLETTSYYKKYKFSGVDDGSTIVTIGFYEGIHELFLKISK